MKKSILAISISVLLSACGGGSDGGSSEPVQPPKPTIPEETIQGIADALNFDPALVSAVCNDVSFECSVNQGTKSSETVSLIDKEFLLGFGTNSDGEFWNDGLIGFDNHNPIDLAKVAEFGSKLEINLVTSETNKFFSVMIAPDSLELDNENNKVLVDLDSFIDVYTNDMNEILTLLGNKEEINLVSNLSLKMSDGSNRGFTYKRELSSEGFKAAFSMLLQKNDELYNETTGPEIPTPEPDQPLIPLEPSKPVAPEEPDQPLIPLEPSKPVEPDQPLIPLEPSTPINTAPTVDKINEIRVLGGLSHFHQVVASDKEQTELSYSISGSAAKFSTIDKYGYLIISPFADQAGNYELTVTVSDGELSTSTNVIVKVLLEATDLEPSEPVNQEPTLDLVGYTPMMEIEADKTVQLQVQASDPDGDKVTVELQDGLGFITLEDNILTIAPTSEHVGDHTFGLSVSDGEYNAMIGYPIVIKNKSATDLVPSEPIPLSVFADKIGYTGDMKHLEMLFGSHTGIGWKLNENGDPLVYIGQSGMYAEGFEFDVLNSTLRVGGADYVAEAPLYGLSSVVNKVTVTDGYSIIMDVSEYETLELKHVKTEQIGGGYYDLEYVSAAVKFEYNDAMLEALLKSGQLINVILGFDAINTITDEEAYFNNSYNVYNTGNTYLSILYEVLIPHATPYSEELSKFADLTGSALYDLEHLSKVAGLSLNVVDNEAIVTVSKSLEDFVSINLTTNVVTYSKLHSDYLGQIPSFEDYDLILDNAYANGYELDLTTDQNHSFSYIVHTADTIQIETKHSYDESNSHNVSTLNYDLKAYFVDHPQAKYITPVLHLGDVIEHSSLEQRIFRDLVNNSVN
ncbi:hypothetical protein [Vibrio sp. CUB2]|uniref:Ig-like domain-containing protein n=1 Tax=Vibrio sp. CUB2 TaxID=2315233 RepID=UPI000769D788|nr:hypothetical protein [Vibrio sp. CUB2]